MDRSPDRGQDKSSEPDHEKERVGHINFADNCFLFAETKKSQILKMIGDAIENLKKRGSEWKEDKMELILWGLDGHIGRALIAKEVDSMSAMRFRRKYADKAMWMDKILEEQRNCGKKKTQKI